MCVLADKRGIACHYPDHVVRLAAMDQGWQEKKVMAPRRGSAKGWELLVPNPKLKLMDQVREVLRIKHYAIRTEQAYCDWIKQVSVLTIDTTATPPALGAAFLAAH